MAGTRLILIGIGIAAMLDSVIAYVMSGPASWDLQTAMRWLTGSLNGATWDQLLPLALAAAVCGAGAARPGAQPVALQLGDDTAVALGVRVERTRILAIVAAVGLIAFATAAAGPIAFVAFLAGPIAARIVGPGGSLLVPGRAGRRAAGAGRRPRRAVRVRHPLPRRGHHRRARRALPGLPARPHQPRRRIAVTDPKLR